MVEGAVWADSCKCETILWLKPRGERGIQRWGGQRPEHASLETLDPIRRALGDCQEIWEEKWCLHPNPILPPPAPCPTAFLVLRTPLRVGRKGVSLGSFRHPP